MDRTKLSPALLAAALSLLASGCAATPAPPARTSTALPPPVAAKLAVTPGSEAVLGKRDDELVALLGVPRLDVIEGQARKLQFTNDRCVLDVFLFPPKQGRSGDRLSTYVEARDRQGNTADTKSCIAALRR